MTRPRRGSATLKRTAPARRLAGDDLAVAGTRAARPRNGARRWSGGLRGRPGRSRAARSSGRRHHGQQRAGAVLLHLDRRVEHVERAGREQPIHDHAEDLRVHVVDLALDHHHAGAAGRRARGLSPIRTRRTFGVAESRGCRRRIRRARRASPESGRTPWRRPSRAAPRSASPSRALRPG